MHISLYGGDSTDFQSRSRRPAQRESLKTAAFGTYTESYTFTVYRPPHSFETGEFISNSVSTLVYL